MGNYDDIIKYLKGYAEKGGKEKVAEDLGPSRPTFMRAIKKENAKLPGSKDLCDWLDKLNAKVVFPDEELNDFILVPKVEAIAGAGESWVTNKDVTAMFAFRRSFINSLAVNPKNIILMTVSGDSMEPLIHNNDMILVDTSDKEVKEGFVYVISIAETLAVKRLQKTLHGWNICSDNKNYPPIHLEGQEVDGLTVIERVRWFGRIM